MFKLPSLRQEESTQSASYCAHGAARRNQAAGARGDCARPPGPLSLAHRSKPPPHQVAKLVDVRTPSARDVLAEPVADVVVGEDSHTRRGEFPEGCAFPAPRGKAKPSFRRQSQLIRPLSEFRTQGELGPYGEAAKVSTCLVSVAVLPEAVHEYEDGVGVPVWSPVLRDTRGRRAVRCAPKRFVVESDGCPSPACRVSACAR